MAAREGEGFYGPEWIVLANDHLRKSISSGITDPDSIVASFRGMFSEFRE